MLYSLNFVLVSYSAGKKKKKKKVAHSKGVSKVNLMENPSLQDRDGNASQGAATAKL